MRRVACLAFLAIVGLLTGIAPAAAQGSPDDQLASPKLRIDWTEFKKLYDAKSVIVVDVRDAPSFEAGHIPGARSIPLDRVEATAAELKKLGKPIVTYCA
jgi:3-mercaptopyruvate sulfurtransferase SseA